MMYTFTMFFILDDDYGDDMCLVWKVHCFEILKARHSKLHEAQELRKGLDDFTRKVEDKTLVGMRPDRAWKPGDEGDIDESDSGNSTPRDVQLALLIPSPTAASSKSTFSPLSTIFNTSQTSSPVPSVASESKSPEKSSPFSRILSARFLSSSPSKP